MSIRTSLDYSSVVINQNQAPSSPLDKRPVNDGKWYYQTFFLPENFTRGNDIPELSGFQIFAGIPAGQEFSTTFDWVVERRSFGVGWVRLASGRQFGVDVAGGEVWPTVIFEGVDVEEAIGERFRIGIKSPLGLSGESGETVYSEGGFSIEDDAHYLNLLPGLTSEITHQGQGMTVSLGQDGTTLRWAYQTGLEWIWYSKPNPLSEQFCCATDDVEDPLLDMTDMFSFCFRVLALTAEEGVDYLGNRYRSAVRDFKAVEADSLNGDPDKAWMSKPNPSRFAVESLYFDVRPTSDVLSYGKTNYILNPNAEGGSGTGLADTLCTSSATSDVAAFRNRSFKIHTTSNGNSFATITLSGADLAPFAGQDAFVSFSSYHPQSWSNPDSLTRLGGIYQTGVADPGAGVYTDYGETLTSLVPRDTWIRRGYRVQNVDASQPLVIVLDNQGIGDVFYGGLMLTVGGHDKVYADGGYPGWVWSGSPHASTSVEEIVPDPEDELAVIDRVFIDTTTPGIWCSVYYSYDGVPGTTDDEWDARVWRRVDVSINLKDRQSYAFPEPVLAKYIKLEFTHLQPQQYQPGDFTAPIVYKKHPTWVLQYFMARLESDRKASEQTVANRVGVTYNALDLLYDYYLDDLSQEPSLPGQGAVPGFDIPSVLSTDYRDRMDAEMLEKIDTAMAPYAEYSNKWLSGSVLGEVALLDQSSTARIQDYPFEKARRQSLQQKTDYASIRNMGVAFEADYPVMFFYLDVEHGYKTVAAPFSHERAYFAGIKEVSFLRDHYTTDYDSEQYIETGGDTFNAERSEFSSLDGKMVIPD